MRSDTSIASKIDITPLTNLKLAILRALETFPDGTASKDIAREISAQRDRVGRKLNDLYDDKFVTRRYWGRAYVWQLTPKSKSLLAASDGLMIAKCKYCDTTDLIPEVDGLTFRDLRHDCGYPYAPSHLKPRVKPMEAKDGPPTRVNRQLQTIYTYAPYQDDDGVWHCGSRTQRGTPCTRLSHVHINSQRCAEHGARRRETRLVTGRYADYLTDTLGDKYAEFMSDPDLLDLRDEVGLLRARLAEDPDESLRTITTVIDTIGRLVTRIVEREEGLKVRISVDRLQVMVAAITDVVMEEITYCPHCGEHLDEAKGKLAQRIGGLKLFE